MSVARLQVGERGRGRPYNRNFDQNKAPEVMDGKEKEREREYK